MPTINGLIPIKEWSDTDLRQYRYWKELKSPDERRTAYQDLRLFGATVQEARRWRDWAEPQIARQIEILLSLEQGRRSS